MADFVSLKPEEQKALSDFSVALRGYTGEIARLMTRLNALNANYNAVVSVILAELKDADASISIKDETGLAGVMPLSPNEMITLVSHIQKLLEINDDAHLQIWVKAAGPTNVVG